MVTETRLVYMSFVENSTARRYTPRRVSAAMTMTRQGDSLVPPERTQGNQVHPTEKKALVVRVGDHERFVPVGKTVLHCHGYTGNAWKGSARTALRKKAP